MADTKKTWNIMVFIPARNEASSLAGVIEDMRKSLLAMNEVEFDIVVGDDGSSDNTAEVAMKHGARVIRHEESVGLGANFQDGVEDALDRGVDILLTIDGDRQFSALDAPKLLEPILTGGYDFVTGSRFLEHSVVNGIPPAKRWGNDRMSKLVSGIIGRTYRDVSCGYRAYNRKALLSLNLFGGFTYTQEVFLNLAYKRLRIKEVPITVEYFPERRSRIAQNLLHYAWQTAKIIIASAAYYRPMWLFGRIALWLGIPGLFMVSGMMLRFLSKGMFSPYKYILFAGIILLLVSFFSMVMGMYLQFASRTQLVLDRILYRLRKQEKL